MKYYTYQYLRPDGSPYYVGKGSGDRVYNRNHTVAVPTLDRIHIQYHFDEATAFAYERYMIDFWGRKDLGTNR